MNHEIHENLQYGHANHEPDDEQDYYTCPMHPDIKQDKPGKCPKCGGMPLVKKSEMDGGEVHHDHASMMASPEAAQDFLHRFYIVTFLLVPLVLLTNTALNILGIENFALRPYLQFGVATIVFYFAFVFFEHARHEMMMKKYGMMTLVSLAVGAGYLFSAASTFLPQLEVEFYIEISTLIWVLLFGHYLEAKSSSAAGDALQEVAKLLPQTAHLKKGDKIVDVPVGELVEGNIVLVKPGEKVPADGEIITGKANMDESLISGESKPVEKTTGNNVIAGSICIDGSIEVKITRVGENSTIGQIQSLITQAQKSKPSAQRLADKASSVLTFTALGVALLTILVWTFLTTQPFAFALTLAITVLVIACPHALGLAIPTVTTIATSLSVKSGLFIKDMAKLEVIKKTDYVVLDKTGTLTKGEFGVSDVIAVNSKSETRSSKQIRNNDSNSKLSTEQIEVLRVAASLELHSSHVIGMSIVKAAQDAGVEIKEPNDFKNIAGKGIQGTLGEQAYIIGNESLMRERSVNLAQSQQEYSKLANEGKTVIFVADQENVIGLIGLSDQIKEESEQAINELHRIGVKVAMLTGDNEKVAAAVAKQLNIDTYFAEVLPEDKYKHIKALQEKGNVVVMVGDGVNDAPALTQADAGVAIGAGTEVAVEAGAVVLTRNNPQDIARLIILAKKVYRKMVENLVWALGYNVVAIPAAAGLFAPLGFILQPAIGALLMAASSVIVVINALTLKRVKLEL